MVAKFENTKFTDYNKYLEYRKNAKKKEKERVKLYIESLTSECFFCGLGENLVFHHVNPNEKEREVTSASSKKQANEEAAKCWCLCQSCHTKLHQRLCDPLPSAYDTRISVP